MLEKQSKFVGGQIRFHIQQWREITSDPYVLQCLTNCQLELEYEPSSYFNQPTAAQKFSTLEQHAIDKKLDEFWSKWIIQISQHERNDIVSPKFILPKKETGKYRVIFN